MANKMISKHLVNLENYFADTQPILKKAGVIFHQLDEFEYTLGLLDESESTACKSSWWPVVSLIGGASQIKNDFIEHYLGSKPNHSSAYAAHHKFTVLQYTPQSTEVTLPGVALDVDHKLPFYQISHKIEQNLKGEGGKINAHLELKTSNSDKLIGKLFIDTPPLTEDSGAVQKFLMKHVLEISDASFIFTDVFDAEPLVIQELLDELIIRQDTHNLIYVVDHSDMSLDIAQSNEIINSWQQRLANLGLNTGYYVVLSDSDDVRLDGIKAIDERLENVEYHRTYRVLRMLEKSIRDVEDVIMPEVSKVLMQWKERSNATTLIVMGFIVSLMLFAEITMGGIILNSILDPIIGPIFLAVLVLFFVPLHIVVSKIHAKFLLKSLYKRQKKLVLIENLAGLFEKSLSFTRILFSIKEPFGHNRKNRKKLKGLIEQTQELVQSLNESFSDLSLAPRVSAPRQPEPLISAPPVVTPPVVTPPARSKLGLFPRRN
ncbi:MAG: hypothetical protein KAG26_04775 [Methylococcales bacterium]|nr:hypothetical protein [Methylococcales bacterium]